MRGDGCISFVSWNQGQQNLMPVSDTSSLWIQPISSSDERPGEHHRRGGGQSGQDFSSTERIATVERIALFPMLRDDARYQRSTLIMQRTERLKVKLLVLAS